jgi:predicted NAD/FAD-dependent oxidoreductase
MADNQLKGISAVPAVTIHATAEFSLSYWDAADNEIADLLFGAASLDSAVVPETTQIQRWLYAQPSVLHPEKFLRIGGVAPLVCAGDAFGGAKVEGAALSGIAAAQELLAALGSDG